jgi:hypothetical protein
MPPFAKGAAPERGEILQRCSRGKNIRQQYLNRVINEEHSDDQAHHPLF